MVAGEICLFFVGDGVVSGACAVGFAGGERGFFAGVVGGDWVEGWVGSFHGGGAACGGEIAGSARAGGRAIFGKNFLFAVSLSSADGDGFFECAGALGEFGILAKLADFTRAGDFGGGGMVGFCDFGKAGDSLVADVCVSGGWGEG